MQTSDSTWQAYNTWGGRCPLPVDRGKGLQGQLQPASQPLFSGVELLLDGVPIVRWLERNGYDVAYCGNIDTHRQASVLQNRKVFISSGHDEYWSGAIRANVEAARQAGLHLIFMTGNEVFWRTRFETSIAGPTTANRTLVCYKESIAHAKIDPSPEWTGTLRDPRFSPPAQGGNNPENSLTGQRFAAILPAGADDFAIQVPFEYSRLRCWRNTSVAQLQSGQVATLAPNTLASSSTSTPPRAGPPAASGVVHHRECSDFSRTTPTHTPLESSPTA